MTTAAMANTLGMTLLVSDVSGQKQRTVKGPPLDASVRDLIQGCCLRCSSPRPTRMVSR